MNTHQGRFEKTRAAERQLESSIASIHKTRAALQYASWENKTHDAIAARQGREQLRARSQADVDALEGRRRRLIAQRAAEMAQWESEVLNATETLEQRKERIREKATKLRDARESARQQFVQEMLDKQWRESCDGARTLDSQAFLEYVHSQRGQQLEEKEVRLQAEAEEDAAFTAQIQERVAFLERQEKEREQRRARAAQQTRDGLTAQVCISMCVGALVLTPLLPVTHSRRVRTHSISAYQTCGDDWRCKLCKARVSGKALRTPLHGADASPHTRHQLPPPPLPPPPPQVRYNAARRMALERHAAEEDRAELAELRALVAAEEQRERARKEAAHARGAQVSC
jgi:hypothetical protein